MYVIKLDTKKNELLVGEEKEIYSKELFATNLNYIIDIDKTSPINIKAKIRYSAIQAEATLYFVDDNTVKIEFKEPQRAITAGQSVVFYIDNIVLGGGRII